MPSDDKNRFGRSFGEGYSYVGAGFAFVPKEAALRVKNAIVIDHEQPLPRCWRANESGNVEVTAEADAVALARLNQFTQAAGRGATITADTVKRARSRGITCPSSSRTVGT